MLKRIVTHPGPAHRDDFYAVCLLLAAYSNVIVERRNPTIADLDNPDVLVLDIGDRLEPALMNFDHHQDLNIRCSMSLVAEFLGLQLLEELFPYLKYLDISDRRGPVFAAKQFGVSDPELLQTPAEQILINKFARDPMDAGIYQIMKDIGADLIDKAKLAPKIFDMYRQCLRTMIGPYYAIIIHSSQTPLFGKWLRIDKPGIHILIARDNRGPGWSVTRSEEAATTLDFYKPAIINSPEVQFVHKGGFVFKTKNHMPLEEVYELIKLAL